MKRQAEKQLIKGDDETEDDDSPNQGFRKADDSVLAGRVIRGLPKRGAARAPTDVPSTTPSLFSSNASTPVGPFKLESTSTPSGTASSFPPAFTGFTFTKTSPAGTTDNVFSGSATSNPFGLSSSSSFTTPSPSPKPSFNLTLSQSPSLPTMSSTATNTSKAFAASLNSSASPFGVNPATAGTFGVPPAISTASTSNGPLKDSVELKYYADLRGLNISILSAILKTVEEDPFFDMANLLEKYKTFRTKIQEDFDTASAKSGSKPEATPSAFTSSDKPAMPAPPASFSGFDAFKPSGSSAPPTSTSKPSPFDFKSSSTGFGASTAPNPFAPAKDSQPSSSPFGTSSFSQPSTSGTSPPNASSTSITFGSPPKPATSQTTSPFGTFGTTPSLGFTLGGTTTQPSSTAPASIFGSGSGSFTFGPGNPTSATSSNIFGSSDAGKSLHFGFASSSASTPTAFGASKPSTESGASTTGENSAEGESSDRATPAAEGGGDAEAPTSALLSSRNPHDEDGEGEENEETVHSIRSKVLRLADGKWVSLGVGILKLKKDKDTGTRRMLTRNSGTGKVMLNFRLYDGLKPSQDAGNPKVIKFIGHEAGVSQTYGVQVKSQEDSNELKCVLDREIAFVKAKEAE